MLTQEQIEALPVGTIVYYWRAEYGQPLKLLRAEVVCRSFDQVKCVVTLDGLKRGKPLPLHYPWFQAYTDRAEALRDFREWWKGQLVKLASIVEKLQ